jgi:hypothetical protein
MSFYQYATRSHLCPNAKSPIALPVEPVYHHTIRVGRGVTLSKHLAGYMLPAAGVEVFGGISGDGLFEGHLFSIFYNEDTDILHIAVDGGNPDGWSGITLTLPSGQNYTCPYDANSSSFVWSGFGRKDFTVTGATITVQMTAVV